MMQPPRMGMGMPQMGQQPMQRPQPMQPMGGWNPLWGNTQMQQSPYQMPQMQQRPMQQQMPMQRMGSPGPMRQQMDPRMMAQLMMRQRQF